MGVTYYSTSAPNEAEPFALDFMQLSVDDEWVQIEDYDVSEREWEHATDTIYRYQLTADGRPVGTLKLTNRSFSTGEDHDDEREQGFYFIEIVKQGAGSGVENRQWELSFQQDISNDMLSDWHDFDDLEYDIFHDSTVGVDELKGPVGLLNMASHVRETSYLFGRQMLSHDLTEQYEGDGESRVRVLDSELTSDVSVGENHFSMDVAWSFPDESERFETWLMYGDQALIDGDHVDRAQEDMLENYRRYHKWITPNGIYAKLPWSVEPFDEMAYGRNLGYQFRDEYLRHYRDYGQFSDYLFTLNSLTVLEAMRDEYGGSELGLIPTEYTSTWLKKPYGVHAPYLDTRHLEGLGLFYLKVEEVLGLDYTDEFLTYADYLVEVLDGDDEGAMLDEADSATLDRGSGYVIELDSEDFSGLDGFEEIFEDFDVEELDHVSDREFDKGHFGDDDGDSDGDGDARDVDAGSDGDGDARDEDAGSGDDGDARDEDAGSDGDGDTRDEDAGSDGDGDTRDESGDAEETGDTGSEDEDSVSDDVDDQAENADAEDGAEEQYREDQENREAPLVAEGSATLLTDYVGPGITTTPHASLNHVLAEIHYLLTAYFKTDDERYLDAAYEMRRAVEIIGADWVRFDDEHFGDLWYQLNADLTFDGNDYDCLTLEDLYDNQIAWEQTMYGPSVVFQLLYESKLESGVCDQI